MAEEPDFFKPHPHPVKARVKNSMFDVVPDAFDGKSIAFTGDQRRVKKTVEEPTPVETPVTDPEPEPVGEPEPEKTPVQESITTAVDTKKIEAYPWDHPEAVGNTL